MTPTIPFNLDEGGWGLRKPEARAAQPIPTLRGSDWAKERSSSGIKLLRAPVLEWYIECHLHGMQAISEVVEVDPDKRGGVPVLSGTRFTIAQILAELAETQGVDDVAVEFDLDAEKIRIMLNGFSLIMQRPCIEK